MTVDKTKKTIVIGHKNPDTDSICSAICYANLKQITSGGEYVPGRAGHVNSETQFVLDYFGMAAPKETQTVKTQVKDIEIRETKGVAKNISLKKAWNLMQDAGVVTIPAVTEDNVLEGLITVGDITRSYMNVYDSSILSKACTQYTNIIETLEGAMPIGDEREYFKEGKVLIAAANPDMMEYYIEKHDLVILGNRYESQLCAIEMEAGCIIVCEGAGVSMTIKKLAQERGCTVITTPYDTYTAARLINQSMPISFFMKTENLITFDTDDYIDDIKEVMASKRHRDFPILDKNGKYKGMISRRNLLGARGKNVILVDHNERSQAANGIDEAEVVEIIDHHRIGDVSTANPIRFMNMPVGSSATIVALQFMENDVEIPRSIAAVLLSAIMTDTVILKSPTATQIDEEVAEKLAAIVGSPVKDFGMKVLSYRGGDADLPIEKLATADSKEFVVGDDTILIAQHETVTLDVVMQREEEIRKFLSELREKNDYAYVLLLVTDIFEEGSMFIVEGLHGHIDRVFGIDSSKSVWVPGILSRKKQVAAPLLEL